MGDGACKGHEITMLESQRQRSVPVILPRAGRQRRAPLASGPDEPVLSQTKQLDLLATHKTHWRPLAIPKSCSMAVANRFLIVGAGFSGAVLARQLVERTAASVVVLDERNHPAGNCHTARDGATGVMVHCYGPHIFHTDRADVWQFVNRFAEFYPFVNRVKAVIARGVFPLPINLLTINQFFGKKLSPAEARGFVASLAEPGEKEPANFEEQAISLLGRELYHAFFHGYTTKQWGCDPKELPASIFKRLPVRFDYNDSYYTNLHFGIPKAGYTALIAGILDHPRIQVQLERRFQASDHAGFDHLFYTGPLDGYFGYARGRLGYRTVSFERIDCEVDDYQGNAVLNYPELTVPWTRIHEHKHFAPWEKHDRTVAFREYSKETEAADVPFYPKRLASDRVLLEQYRALAAELKHISFLGRLGTYSYLDMDQVIAQALEFASLAIEAIRAGTPLPVFPAGPS